MLLTLAPFAGWSVTVETVSELVAALEDVNNGGSDTTINIKPGTYDVSAVNMNADGHLFISSTCTLQGTDDTSWRDNESGETAVIIDAKDVSRIVYVYKDVKNPVFRNLTFQNGHARRSTETPPDGWEAFTDTYERGGAISHGKNGDNKPGELERAIVSNCVFRSCTATQGGGTYNCNVWQSFYTNNTTKSDGSAVTAGQVYGCRIVGNSGLAGTARNCSPICDSVFIGNSAVEGGVAFGSFSAVSNCIFIGNSATGYGGALRDENPASSPWIVHNCVFVDNYARWGGGACYGIHLISDSYFTNNVATSKGGAILDTTDEVEKCIQRCVFYGNSVTNMGASSYGGAVYDSCLYDCTLDRNSATTTATTAYGGATYGCYLTNCTLTANHAYQGGATYGGTNDTCTFDGNWAIAAGGGAYKGEQRACTFIGNKTWSDNWMQGGGGCHSATLVTGCVFRLNVTLISGGVTNGYGGGTMYCPEVRDSFFEQNYASKGAAACVSSLYDCVITNCSSVMSWGDASDGVGMSGNTAAPACEIVRSKIYDCYGVDAGDGRARAVHGMSAVDCEIIGGGIFDSCATRCIFRGRDGKTIPYISDSVSTVTSALTNCLIADVAVNIAFRENTSLVNCTVANVSSVEGLIGSSLFSAINTLFAGNSQNGTASDISVISGLSSFSMTNCLFQTATSAALSAINGTGNIQISSGRSFGFVGSEGEHPYSLRHSSPARNSGYAIEWDDDATDLAGNARVNGTVDIGCYECYLLPVGTEILFR